MRCGAEAGEHSEVDRTVGEGGSRRSAGGRTNAASEDGGRGVILIVQWL